MKDKDYDFNRCIRCQERHKDVPCDENCRYLEELKKGKEDEKI